MKTMTQSRAPMHDKYYPILPGAEPFLLTGKAKAEVGCLLVHGFTGTPLEMRGLGEHLAGEGYTALGVRLNGHATHPGEMARTTWVDWFASVRDGYEMLQANCQQVFVIGLSLGGILAFTLASQSPVSGVAALATPHHLPRDPRLRFIKLIALFKPYKTKSLQQWFDDEAFAGHISYPIEPVRCYADLVELIEVMQAGLSQIKAPVILINSRQDPTVRSMDGHLEAFLQELGSVDKKSFWIEGSGHVITRDAQRHVVFEAISEFVAAHCAHSISLDK